MPSIMESLFRFFICEPNLVHAVMKKTRNRFKNRKRVEFSTVLIWHTPCYIYLQANN